MGRRDQERELELELEREREKGKHNHVGPAEQTQTCVLVWNLVQKNVGGRSGEKNQKNKTSVLTVANGGSKNRRNELVVTVRQ